MLGFGPKSFFKWGSFPKIFQFFLNFPLMSPASLEYLVTNERLKSLLFTPLVFLERHSVLYSPSALSSASFIIFLVYYPHLLLTILQSWAVPSDSDHLDTWHICFPWFQVAAFIVKKNIGIRCFKESFSLNILFRNKKIFRSKNSICFLSTCPVKLKTSRLWFFLFFLSSLLILFHALLSSLLYVAFSCFPFFLLSLPQVCTYKMAFWSGLP